MGLFDFSDSESTQKIYTKTEKPIIILKNEYKRILNCLYMEFLLFGNEQEYNNQVQQLDEAYLMAKTRLTGFKITIEVEK